MSLVFADEMTGANINWSELPSLTRILKDPDSWMSDKRFAKITKAAKVLIEHNSPLSPAMISDILDRDAWRSIDKFLWQHVGDAVTLPLADCDAELLIHDHGRSPLGKQTVSEREGDVV